MVRSDRDPYFASHRARLVGRCHVTNPGQPVSDQKLKFVPTLAPTQGRWRPFIPILLFGTGTTENPVFFFFFKDEILWTHGPLDDVLG